MWKRIRAFLALLRWRAGLAWAALRDVLTLRTTASELARLNDSLESVMLHFSIPRYSRAELSVPPPPIEVYESDEAEDAFREWKDELDTLMTPPNVVDPTVSWPEYPSGAVGSTPGPYGESDSFDSRSGTYSASLFYGASTPPNGRPLRAVEARARAADEADEFEFDDEEGGP